MDLQKKQFREIITRQNEEYLRLYEGSVPTLEICEKCELDVIYDNGKDPKFCEFCDKRQEEETDSE
jgi:hypothetical protein